MTCFRIACTSAPWRTDLVTCIPRLLQYNVTVAGIVQSGQKRQGLNSLQLTTTLDMGLRMLDITATSSTTATARAAPGAGAKFVAYIFSVRRADCPTCKPLTFRSGPDGKIDISGLEPGMKVGGAVAGWLGGMADYRMVMRGSHAMLSCDIQLTTTSAAATVEAPTLPLKRSQTAARPCSPLQTLDPSPAALLLRPCTHLPFICSMKSR